MLELIPHDLERNQCEMMVSICFRMLQWVLRLGTRERNYPSLF
jgi:hypothetical protein